MAVVLTDHQSDVERFRVTLSREVTVVTTAQDLHTWIDAHPDEDLVIIGPSTSMPVACDIAERYRIERPTLGVLLLRTRVEMGIMAQALRAGVREVVPTDDLEALVSASKRSLELSQLLRGTGRPDQEGSRGRVIVVFGAKGGGGKTTIATNLAAAIAGFGVGSVCLVDYDLEFGDVAMTIRVEPVVTISRAIHMQGELDNRAVAALVTSTDLGFDVVLAPTTPADAELITPDLAEDVIRNLAQMYAFVVIDAAPSFHEMTLRCLEHGDALVLVSTLDVSSLKNIKVALETLDALGMPRSKWRIVLNRAGGNIGLSNEDVEDMLGVPISVSIPSSRDVPVALNNGQLIVLAQPDHPVSRALRRLAELECGRDPGDSRRLHRPWLRRLLGRS